MAVNTDVVFSARVVDELGVEMPVTFYIEADDGQTLAAVATAWGAWISSIDAVTAGQIVAGKVTINPNLPGGLKAAPVAGSRVEAGAVLNWTHAGSNRRAGFFIPALKGAAISAGKVLLTQADVAALLAEVAGAVLGGNYAAPSFQIITGFRDAFLAFRKRRRQLRSESFEL